MLELYCPYGCDLTVGGHLPIIKRGIDNTKPSEKVTTCPVCKRMVKITIKFLPHYTCEKAEKESLFERIKKWLPLSLMDNWIGR